MEQIDPVGLVVVREDTGNDDKKDKIRSYEDFLPNQSKSAHVNINKAHS